MFFMIATFNERKFLNLSVFFSLILCCRTTYITPFVDLDSRTSSSLELKFEAFSDSSYGDVIGYEISKRALTSAGWDIINDKYLILSGWNQYEQQVVAVKVDDDKSLWQHGGSFSLGVVRNHLNPLNVDDETSRTPKIPWNADEKTFLNALKQISSIKVKEVHRCDTFKNYDGTKFSNWVPQCPYGSRGGYSWLIVFDIPVRSESLPLLYPLRIDLKDTWTGIGEQVVVTRQERGLISPYFCDGRQCKLNVTDLEESMAYTFRVRAKTTALNWTDYSKASEFVSTLTRQAPSRPQPPVISSATATSISFHIPSLPPSQGVNSYQYQYRAKGSNSWLQAALKEARAPGASIMAFTLTSLIPDTTYEVRIRAVNDVSPSVFSSAVLATTLGDWMALDKPDAPLLAGGTSVPSDHILLTVSANVSHSHSSGKLAYNLQYKGVEDRSWRSLKTSLWSKALKQRVAPVVVQEVEVRSDGSTVKCDGSFTLSLGAVEPSALHRSVSSAIAFGASEDDVVTAIKTIVEPFDSGMGDLRIICSRSFRVDGGFVYRLELHGVRPDIPLLQLYKEDLSTIVISSALQNASYIPLNSANATNVTTAISNFSYTAFTASSSPCWRGAGPVVLTRYVSPRDSVPKSVLTETIRVENLQPHTEYMFRLTAQLSDGTSAASSDILRVTTGGGGSLSQSSEARTQPNAISQANSSVIESANGSTAARTSDIHYIEKIGMGGGSGQDGRSGVCMVSCASSALGSRGSNEAFRDGVSQRVLDDQRVVFYSGAAQRFVVPSFPEVTNVLVTVKCWGGGGGGGKLPSHVAGDVAGNYSAGGGGGFAQGSFWLTGGSTVNISVGGGGEGSSGEDGGRGGWPNGGNGGHGSRGGGGGGGGGSSLVFFQDSLLLVAAGGGGGGSTDYCCGGGGSGGGIVGGDGSFPGDQTPWPITAPGFPTPVLRRYDYTSSSCPDGPAGDICISEWDVRPHSLPPNHRNLDYGVAAWGNYSAWSKAGVGGQSDSGGMAGDSGSFEISFEKGSPIVDGQSNGLVATYRLTSGLLVRAKRGSYLVGRDGSDGKDAGGGGGGGLWGGGGGGAGIDGAGGGGGSSFVNTDLPNSALDSASASSSSSQSDDIAAPNAPITMYVNDTFISLSFSIDAINNNAVQSFELEMSNGPKSDDFSLVTSTLPLSGIACESIMPIYFSSSTENCGYFQVSNLNASTWYSFRVCPLYSGGRGLCSVALAVRTLPGAMQSYWEPVLPRRLNTVSRGRGLAAPVLQRPHLDPDVEIFAEGSTVNVRRTTDPPTSVQPVFPSPRRGSSFSTLQDGAFLFGGRTDGTCSTVGLSSYSQVTVVIVGYTCASTYKDTLNLGSPESGRDVFPCARYTNEVRLSRYTNILE